MTMGGVQRGLWSKQMQQLLLWEEGDLSFFMRVLVGYLG